MRLPRDVSGEEKLKKVDVLILTPLAVEWAAMVRKLNNGSAPTRVGVLVELGEIGRYTIAVGRCGKYESPAAARATSLIEKYNPYLVIVVGVAGAFRGSEFHRGDVIIARHVYGVSGKVEKGRFVRRPALDWVPHPNFVDHVENFAEMNQDWVNGIGLQRPDHKTGIAPHVDSGYLLSLDITVDDFTYSLVQDILDELLEVDAVEMEGSGVGMAIKNAQLTQICVGIMIRAISDEISSSSGPEQASGSAQRRLWKRYASEVAATFVHAFLSKLPSKIDESTEKIEQTSREQAICEQAPAEFEIRRKLGETASPGSPASMIENSIEKEWKGLYAPKWFMVWAINVRIKNHLIPLIQQRIDIEMEMRQSHKLPLSADRIRALRSEIIRLIDAEWKEIVYEGYDDALKYVSLKYVNPKYKMKEIDEFYESYKNQPPPSQQGGNLFRLLDLFLVAAKAKLELTIEA